MMVWECFLVVLHLREVLAGQHLRWSGRTATTLSCISHDRDDDEDDDDDDDGDDDDDDDDDDDG